MSSTCAEARKQKYAAKGQKPPPTGAAARKNKRKTQKRRLTTLRARLKEKALRFRSLMVSMKRDHKSDKDIATAINETAGAYTNLTIVFTACLGKAHCSGTHNTHLYAEGVGDESTCVACPCALWQAGASRGSLGTDGSKPTNTAG